MNLKQLRNRAFLVGALSSPFLAQAAAIAVPAELTDAGASVLVIGAAVFAIAVGIKLYKWISRAL
jgi:hypothetical protein